MMTTAPISHTMLYTLHLQLSDVNLPVTVCTYDDTLGYLGLHLFNAMSPPSVTDVEQLVPGMVKVQDIWIILSAEMAASPLACLVY
jgi:hypothetical protein